MNDKELIEELREYATALRASVHVPHTGADLIERGADALAARQPTEDGTGRVEAWHRIAAHPAFSGCIRGDMPLIDSMPERLDSLSRAALPDAATERQHYDEGFEEGITAGKEVRDAALAAVERVRAIHQKKEADAVTGDCATESCEHEDKCPTQAFEVCIACWNLCEEADPYFGERGIGMVLWPCPAIAALDGAPEPEWEHALFVADDDGVERTTSWAPGEFDEARQRWPGLVFEEKRRISAPWLPVEGEKP